MEALLRGVVARNAEKNGIFISWRNLASEDCLYNIYRNGIKLNSAPMDKTNYVDESGTDEDTYFITAVDKSGKEGARSEGVKPFRGFCRFR